MKKNVHHFLLLLALVTLPSCSTTPISGKKAFLLTSEAQENAQGDEAYKEILQSEKVITGTRESKMVEDIGKKIAAVANKPDFQWEFKTIQSDTPNAFCLPGGKVAVYTGIFKYAQNEAGLATIMGHEIGHALARHGGQRMSQAVAANIAMAGIAAVGFSKMDPTKKQFALAALGVGATIGIILPFSRAHETEADEIGLTLMSRAGYAPEEAVHFWDRFSKAGEGKSPPEFLSTHPTSSKRKENLERLQAQAMNDYQSSPKYGRGKDL